MLYSYTHMAIEGIKGLMLVSVVKLSVDVGQQSNDDQWTKDRAAE